MPGKMQVLNAIVISLQYSLVILLYYFLYRVVKIAVQDLSKLVSDEPQAQLFSQQQQPHGSVNSDHA